MQDHARARRLSRRRALGAAGAGTAELDIAERLPPKGPHLADDVEGSQSCSSQGCVSPTKSCSRRFWPLIGRLAGCCVPSSVRLRMPETCVRDALRGIAIAFSVNTQVRTWAR